MKPVMHTLAALCAAAALASVPVLAQDKAPADKAAAPAKGPAQPAAAPGSSSTGKEPFS